MKNNGIKAAVAVLALLSLAACKGEKEKENNEDMAAMEQMVAEVDTITLQRQVFQKQLLCNGKLVAAQKAELPCPQPGSLVQRVCVKNGQVVSKGTLLCVADTRTYQAELEKSKHDMERSRVELQDKLIGLGYDGNLEKVPAEVLKRAEVISGYYAAKYQLQASQKQLKDCELRAPFAGRVANLEARENQPGGKFCVLIDDAFFEVEFKILEAELNFVKTGQQVVVSPFADKDKRYLGTVTGINPMVDEKGLVAVTARVKNSGDGMMDGMNVRVIVENAMPNMLVVPKEAVVERDGYHVIFLYDKQTQRAVWTYVDVLYSNLGQFAITGCEKKETTLHEGSCVIVSGNLNLADDTEVTISRENK